MIDVLRSNDRRGFGIETALATAGVSRRYPSAPADASGRALVTGCAGEAPGVADHERPTLVIGPGPPAFRGRFAAREGAALVGPAMLDLDEPVWPAAVREVATTFGVQGLSLPRAALFRTAGRPAGTVLARVRTADGQTHAAVLEQGGRIWSPLDLASALTDLLDEAYLPAMSIPPASPLLRPVLAVYYRAPEAVRVLLQRRAYARLARRLGPWATSYPVDATGWLLIELIVALVRRAAGRLVRVAPWPAPYRAAAALTHDVEPTAFAYGAGLDALLARIRETGHPATLGLVAGPASRHLGGARAARLREHGALCHGLEHRGETVMGSRDDVLAGIERARTLLEGALGWRVEGFRSPRLDRTDDLLWALDHSGFRWDSSYPDVDRENVARFGGGVRLNVPFRPPIEEAAGPRASRCLELPVSAPDCIQPLFAGEDEAALRRAVVTKVDFIHRTGGLYTGIVHAGVFGRRDAARRGAHLAFTAGLVRRPDVWLAQPAAIAEWWCAREQLRVVETEQGLEVTNGADAPVADACAIVDGPSGETHHVLPPLAAGERTHVALGTDRVRPAAGGMP